MTSFLNNNNCAENDNKCITTNTISFLVGIITLAAYIILIFRNFLLDKPAPFLDLERLLFLSIFSFLSYFLHKKGFKVLSKFILIYSFVVFIIYYPVFIGAYSPDVYILYPLFILLLGVLTQIIFYFTKEKYYYIFVIASLLGMLHLTDKIYSVSFEGVDIMKEWGTDYFVIKLGFVSIFLTINTILYTILKRDAKSQREITRKSVKIEKKNDLIKQKNSSLLQKNFELKELQEEVTVQNEELQSHLEEIRAQRDEIERKNEEIIQSFTYARRIQNSMIPKGKILYSFFEEFFVFNKPKDILSGDFFWTFEYEDKIIVAVADCTGHGVPASLLSVLGISTLNEIVLKYKKLKPSEILNHLRTRIIISLSQSENIGFNKDGMDISLIMYNKKDMLIDFAGAYNPLVIVRDKIILSLDGDRMPIGISEAEKQFSNQQISVKKDDVIYMFSDGFSDQFGGTANKKLKRKQFKDLLIKTHSLPLVVQKERLSLFFKEWKGDYEQVDDVLIIGLKV